MIREVDEKNVIIEDAALLYSINCDKFVGYAYRGDYDAVEQHIKNGNDINCVNKLGRTALHDAVFRRNFDVVELLLKNGIDVDIPDYHGCTALFHAITISNVYNMYDFIKILIDNGCDLTIENSQGINAIDYAHKMNPKPLNGVLNLLTTKKEGKMYYKYESKYCDDFIVNAFNGNYNEVEKYIFSGNDINCVNKLGRTALHDAVFSREKNIINLLLQNGINSNIQDTDGNTPIFHAITISKLYDMRYIIQTLILYGCDLNIKNLKKQTPLDLALNIEAPEEIITILKTKKESKMIRENNFEEIFIRALTKKEIESPTLKKKALYSFPEKEGYEVVYKPYGNVGKGFYYVLKTIKENKMIRNLNENYENLKPIDLYYTWKDGDVKGVQKVFQKLNGYEVANFFLHLNMKLEFVDIRKFLRSMAEVKI